MTSLAHERHVARRFDAEQARFRPEVGPGDYRLAAVAGALGDVRGLRVLDLGCGKGRFARHFRERGARVVGLDASPGMITHASGLARVLGTASRLPFPSASFDAVMAVEVLEHLAPVGVVAALGESRRVLKPGGHLAIVDKNLLALDADRPWLPKLAIKKIDERRGRWMYPAGGPVRERWFRPGALAMLMKRLFLDVRCDHLLSPEEARRAVFRRVPAARLMALWTARAPGGPR